MATRFQLAEQAQRILAGGDPSPDFKPSIQELSLAATQVMAKVVWLSYQQHKAEDQNGINGQFIASFDGVEVSLDEAKKLFYSVLPNSPIKLPHDMGVYLVCLQEDQTMPFIPLPNGFMPMSRNMRSSQLEGRMGYYVESNRLYYVGMTAYDSVKNVLLKLVITGANLDDEDDFDVSPEIQSDVVMELVKMFSYQAQLPEDNVNDHQKTIGR